MKKSFISIYLLLIIISQSLFVQIETNHLFPEHLRLDLYRDIIEGKSVAVVANQTSMVGQNTPC